MGEWLSMSEMDERFPIDEARNPYGVKKGQTWEVRERWGFREMEVVSEPRWDAVRSRAMPAVRTLSQRGNTRSLMSFRSLRFISGPEPSDKARRSW